MKSRTVHPLCILCLVAAILTGMHTVAQAQNAVRAGRPEIYAFGQFLGSTAPKSDEIRGNLGSITTFGAGGGYNINAHFNVNTDISYGKTTFRVASLGISAKPHVWAWNVNLDYNVLKTPLTPVVTGGLGMVYFSAARSATTEKISEADFTYTVGGGVRWDITPHFFAKAVYRFTRTKLSDTDNHIVPAGPAVTLGYIF